MKDTSAARWVDERLWKWGKQGGPVGSVVPEGFEAWKDELVAVDDALRLLAEQLPPDTALVITGDHGMLDLRPEERLDLADHPDLATGITLMAGEARARYLRAALGATADVLSAWRSTLGDRM